ncbi:heterokaryon incompatibility protein-domain-containing protein [Thelonectria olida]|uniref:Heterokaryon incompatibility protein-domain-containing protein n=1 Tax=Thelonectria olida TaxID=1576542 RepID=A0A9P9AVM6_9HYPO|nr:heterokaryon incompatibility protein-domain-containing protein [Thelonectria olida]
MWLFKSSGPDFKKTVKGIDRQTLCRGCSRIEILLDRSQRESGIPPGRLPFHKDYAELDECAKNCHTCRIFRQALLLKCATVADAEQLSPSTGTCPVYARVQQASSESSERFVINIEIRGFPDRAAKVRCFSDMVENLNLAEDPNSARLFKHARQWVSSCYENHQETCSGLRWSSQNPTRLVGILSDSELQLCELEGEAVRYVALSYSWGTQILSKDEAAQLERGKTTSENLGARRISFSIAALPPTLRDAITFCRRMGISYIWIDSLCILQDDADKTDFVREAPKMHQYYGNAHFTLAVCSNLKATDPLLTPRTAYSHSLRPSRLGGLWISTFDLSMTDMLSQSPLSARAWTLQEQCLSPRILYWTPNRMYWSCARSQMVESIDLQDEATNSKNATSPQAFLLECNRGTSESRHREWLSVIESYTLRDMSNPMDRFAALSALASKYKSSFNVNQGYIAGLWDMTFAEDLSWAVIRPASTEPKSGSREPPSWTWASLPLCTGVRTTRGVTASQGFQLVKVDVPGDGSHALDSDETILRGALVKNVTVRARLRPFWENAARYQPWPTIVVTVRQENNMDLPLKQIFSFSNAPEQPIFSADMATGKIVSYEVRKQETVGQLDYIAHAARVCRESIDIFSMEIADNSMLLLEKVDHDKFRRVGMATSYRPDFFEGLSQEAEFTIV